MKHIYLLFVFLIVFVSCSPPEPVEVQIPDPNLASAVREALGISPDAPIMDNELKKLKDLMASERSIKDLTGLEKAKEFNGFIT